MGNTSKVFYDGLENIRMVEGVIHLDFYDINGKTKVPAGEVVLSQTAFLRMYGAMTNLIGQLEAAGLVKRTTGENGKPTGPDAADAPASPNFQ